MTQQPEDKPDAPSVEKKPYTTPKLERLGPVEDLTQLAPLQPGTDTMIVLGTH
jgi:hypothetical protein